MIEGSTTGIKTEAAGIFHEIDAMNAPETMKTTQLAAAGRMYREGSPVVGC